MPIHIFFSVFFYHEIQITDILIIQLKAEREMDAQFYSRTRQLFLRPPWRVFVHFLFPYTVENFIKIRTRYGPDTRVAARHPRLTSSSQLSIKTADIYAATMVADESLASGYGIGFELIFTMGKIKNGIDLPWIRAARRVA